MEREERRGEERSFGDKGGRIHTLRLGREACRRNRTSQRKDRLREELEVSQPQISVIQRIGMRRCSSKQQQKQQQLLVVLDCVKHLNPFSCSHLAWKLIAVLSKERAAL